MDQRALYEQIAAGGGGCGGCHALAGRDQFVIADIRRHFGAGRQVAIAELSIGDGGTTLALLSTLPNVRLTCAEISPSRIDQVRTAIIADPTLSPRVPDFVACNFDTEFDRLPNEAFDIVIALDIMEHVLDVFGFMANCHRILRQGGRFFLRVPNIAYLRHRLRLLLGRIPVTASWFETPGELASWRDKHGWDGGHLHLFTIPILMRLFSESGFVVEGCKDPGTRLEALRVLWPGLLFSNPLIIAHKA